MCLGCCGGGEGFESHQSRSHTFVEGFAFKRKSKKHREKGREKEKRGGGTGIVSGPLNQRTTALPGRTLKKGSPHSVNKSLEQPNGKASMDRVLSDIMGNMGKQKY